MEQLLHCPPNALWNGERVVLMHSLTSPSDEWWGSFWVALSSVPSCALSPLSSQRESETFIVFQMTECWAINDDGALFPIQNLKLRKGAGCGSTPPVGTVSRKAQRKSTDPLSPEAHPALEPLRSLHDIWLRRSPGFHYTSSFSFTLTSICRSYCKCEWIKNHSSLTSINAFIIYTHYISWNIHSGQFIRQITAF